MDRRRSAHAHFVGHAQAAAEFSRAAGVLAQSSLFDDDRALRFRRFDRRVVGVAVVQTNRRAHAVFIVLGAPTAARMAYMRPEKAARLRVETVRIDRAQVGVVTGDRALRASGSQRSKNCVAYG